ncbi:hypothetical protein JCM8547_000649 [Rhodosporidiobolus lusitaniae]
MSRTFADEIELQSTPQAHTDGSTRPASLASTPSSIGKDVDSRPSSFAGLPELEVDEVQRQRTTLRRLSMGDGEGEGAELGEIDGGRKAWTFVVAGFVLEYVPWSYAYSWPAVLVFLEQHDPWRKSSLATLSSIGSVLLALQFFVPIFAMSFFKRYPEWRVIFLSACVAVNGASMLGSAWATKTEHLIVLQGVLGGLSGAALYAPVLSDLSEWWVKRRGMASGIVFSGSSIGGIFCPFLIDALLKKYGFARMCQVWAAMTVPIYAFTIWGVRPRLPLRKPAKGQRSPWLAVHPKFLLDPIVLTMAFVTMIQSLPYYMVSFYTPTYTLHLGTSSSSTVVVALVNASASLGAIVLGWASDRSLPWTMVVMSLWTTLTSVLGWGFSSSLTGVFLFAVTYSFATAVFSLWGAGARDAAGSNPHLSTMILGFFSVSRGIASIVGPLLGTALYDPKQAEERSSFGRFGFSHVIIAVGVLSFVGVFGAPMLVWARKVNEKKRLAAA